MNKKLVFYPEKMTWVCVLLGIAVIARISPNAYIMFFSEQKASAYDYAMMLNGFLLPVVPFVITLIIINRSQNCYLGNYFKALFLCEAVLSLVQIVFIVLTYYLLWANLEDSLGFLPYDSLGEYMLVNYFSILKAVVAATCYTFYSLFDNKGMLLKISRIVLFASSLYDCYSSVMNTINTFNNEHLKQSFAISQIVNLLITVSLNAALFILLFIVSKIETPNSTLSIEEKFRSLDEKYAAGQIGKEAYEAARAELLKQL
ncbi:unknown [Clostridium sp. CAG:413]|nr:unknown [Clostridium sp. CAG:413]